MEKVACFGIGKIGKQMYYRNRGEIEIVAFIDNDRTKWGKTFWGIPIISLDEFIKCGFNCKIMITCNEYYSDQIRQQLETRNISNYIVYTSYPMEDLVSYSNPYDKEDLILYHALHEIDDIFYIDVGSNDPILYSVTKLLYDMKGARGINIDPQKELIEKTRKQRRRDISLCVGVGDKAGRMELYLQGGLSTVIAENVKDWKNIQTETMTLTTLSEICRQNISDHQEISFLKIDVEGFEKEALMGADFTKYRPWIVIMESTKPCSLDYSYDTWEDILFKNRYHFVKEYGVNRYYVADEKREFDHRFIPIEDLEDLYNIYQVQK